ncbi:MAG: type II toxin-antitoxin system RelE/ParE family toxin [Elusimicrobia bacterium]|nr:type II toxin-antitoxin system RelE/ParE family toxin [Elusimicrobiota bacterium]
MYSIELSRTAESVYRWLFKHDRKLFARIDAALEFLKQDPFQGKPLKGHFQGDRSYRVGSHRIIYTIVRQRLLVYILDIGHRREVYR